MKTEHGILIGLGVASIGAILLLQKKDKVKIKVTNINPLLKTVTVGVSVNSKGEVSNWETLNFSLNDNQKFLQTNSGFNLFFNSDQRNSIAIAILEPDGRQKSRGVLGLSWELNMLIIEKSGRREKFVLDQSLNRVFTL